MFNLSKQLRKSTCSNLTETSSTLLLLRVRKSTPRINPKRPASKCLDLGSKLINIFTVHAAVPSNTFAIYGNGEDKELTELVPGILNQLGPDSLASLRKLAESYQSMQKEKGEDGEKKDDDDDDDIPDLVAGENSEGDNKPDVE